MACDRCIVNRYFFDYTAKDESLLDYRGHEFRTIQGAIEFAHAIVQDLNHSLCTKWIGWSVEIRNAEGKKFLSVPVESQAARAA
jgi:hypothetical protein